MRGLEVEVRGDLAPGRGGDPAFRLEAAFALEGRCGVLFGPSGSGKSQTLRFIAGLPSPGGRLEGRVVLEGRTLFDSAEGVNRPARERRIGLVFQELALFPHLTVEENLRLASPSRGRAREDQRLASELLARFRLEGFGRRRPGELSGGQRQRVALARALAARPQALLLDEPFSALDGPLRRSLRREIRALAGEADIPILVVTHLIEDLCALADRVFVLRDGRLTGNFPIGRLFGRSDDPRAEESGEESGGRGAAWSALGWGNLLVGRVGDEPPGGCFFEGEGIRLRLAGHPAPGPASVFIPPDGVKVLYPGLPVDPEIRPNAMEGRVEEAVPLGNRLRLEISCGGRLWQVEREIREGSDAEFGTGLVPGAAIRFAVPPGRIETLRGGADAGGAASEGERRAFLGGCGGPVRDGEEEEKRR
jgi:molybdate transport system ATP-binding protein